jgi:hypothetical protein
MRPGDAGPDSGILIALQVIPDGIASSRVAMQEIGY